MSANADLRQAIGSVHLIDDSTVTITSLLERGLNSAGVVLDQQDSASYIVKLGNEQFHSRRGSSAEPGGLVDLELELSIMVETSKRNAPSPLSSQKIAITRSYRLEAWNEAAIERARRGNLQKMRKELAEALIQSLYTVSQRESG